MQVCSEGGIYVLTVRLDHDGEGGHQVKGRVPGSGRHQCQDSHR
jgi:hypothetical protein